MTWPPEDKITLLYTVGKVNLLLTMKIKGKAVFHLNITKTAICPILYLLDTSSTLKIPTTSYHSKAHKKRYTLLKFLSRYSEKVGKVTDQIQPVYERTTT